MSRPLRVFLCHSSNDKPAVRELYQKLRAESWIQPWLDEEELYPGQDWNLEIEKAVEAADAIIVCLSKGSITKEGYVQRELRIVLDYADYKPEGTLYLMPVRLEECDPPRRLRPWQYADYFEGQRERGLQRLLVSLKRRAESLSLETETPAPVAPFESNKNQAEGLTYAKKKSDLNFPRLASVAVRPNKITLSNGMEFMRVPAGMFLMGSTKENKSAYDDERPQHEVTLPDYWMARYPVTNELYNAYVKSKGIKHPVDGWEKIKDHPVVNVKWMDVMMYCQWLNSLLKSELPAGMVLRLPTEAEWEKSARGTDGREYPWGNTFDKNKCNASNGGKGGTTSVGTFSPQGDSPYGCADISGNVWEWTHSLKKAYPYKIDDGRENEKVSGTRVLRGGSFVSVGRIACCVCRDGDGIANFNTDIGFRVVVASPILS